MSVLFDWRGDSKPYNEIRFRWTEHGMEWKDGHWVPYAREYIPYDPSRDQFYRLLNLEQRTGDEPV